MQLSSVPVKFPIPFANDADPSYIQYPIPEASQVGIVDGAASLETGFPPLNFQPVGAGGVPPRGVDFNGLLKQVTAWNQWQQAGGPIEYDAAFQTDIGGYPEGAVIQGANPGTSFISTADDNMSNPLTGGANWIEGPVYTETTTELQGIVSAAGGIHSFKGSGISVPNATPTTIFDIATATAAGVYIVTVNLGQSPLSAVAMFGSFSGGAVLFNNGSGSASLTLSIVGSNLTATQTTGSGQTAAYAVLKIA